MVILFGQFGAPARGLARTPEERLSLVRSAEEEHENVLETFRALSRLSRPSGREDVVRRFFVDLAERANAASGRVILRYESDAAGNLLLTREGTGRFKGVERPIAVVQAHMDMVWAVAGAEPGESLAPYFAGGVDLVETDGWLHSRDFKTTLGADNGIGLAMVAHLMTRLVEDQAPMEFLLTASEEQGLLGAKRIALMPRAPVLIGLDTMYRDSFVLGCLGSQRVLARAHYRSESPMSDAQALRVSLAGLKGGHSGHDIGKSRLNAIGVMLDLLRGLDRELTGGIRISSATVGAEKVLNVIPSSAELVVFVARSQVSLASDLIRKSFTAALEAASEDARDAVLSIVPVQDAPLALTNEDTRRLLDAMGDVRNGPISRIDAGTINTSSNLGYFALSTQEGTGLRLGVGYMMRSYDERELSQFSAANQAALKRLTPHPEATHVEAILPHSPTWRADTSRPFYEKVFSLLPHYQRRMTAGGIEPAVFAQKWPDKDYLTLGAEIKDAHSPRESLNLKSVHATVAALGRILEMLAEGAHEVADGSP